jgi:hypothetical protein
VNKKECALKIVSDLTKKLKESKLLYSLTPLGTELKSRKFNKTEDIDFCMVIGGKMTKEKLQKIKAIFRSMKKYSTKEIDVCWAVKDGPMKPVSKKEHILFLHAALHTIESYKKAPEVLRYSWQFKKPIFGKSLKEIAPEKKITKEILLNTSLGLKDSIALCNFKKTAYLDWVCAGGKCRIKRIHSKELKGKELLDLYFYTVLRGAGNYLKFVKGPKIEEIGIKEQMCKEFYNLGLSISDIPKGY